MTELQSELLHSFGMKRKSAESFSSSGAGTHMTGEPAEGEAKMPQKRFFRMRAHCNPLSHNDGFNYPVSPAAQRDGRPLWELYYPQIQAEDRVVRNLDIGMG